MTDMTPGGVVEAATPGSGGAGVRESGEGSKTPVPPRIGSLCSGYGGLDMGLMAVVGGSVAWHVEYDKAPSKILAHHWPDVPNYGDITTTDWTQVEPVDWLTAGYPCQPFSHAGKRKGTTDERHIWPHVAAAIGVLRPGQVLLENVAGHVSLGLDVVLADLAALRYDATWIVVRAADAGAPHGRPRLFVLAADASHDRLARSRVAWPGRDGSAYRGNSATDSDCAEQSRQHSQLDGAAAPSGCRGSAWGPYRAAVDRWAAVVDRPAPAPTEPGRTGQRLSPRFVEWMQGLPAGHVTDVDIPRNAQLKALGNGVVPQQAALALRTLLPLCEVAA